MVPSGESGMDMKMLLYLTWRTSKDLLSSTGNSAQYSVITLWSPGGRMGEGIVREFGMDMDTLLYLTWRSNKKLVSRTGSSAQYLILTHNGKEYEKKRCIYVRLYNLITLLHT